MVHRTFADALRSGTTAKQPPDKGPDKTASPPNAFLAIGRQHCVRVDAPASLNIPLDELRTALGVKFQGQGETYMAFEHQGQLFVQCDAAERASALVDDTITLKKVSCAFVAMHNSAGSEGFFTLRVSGVPPFGKFPEMLRTELAKYGSILREQAHKHWNPTLRCFEGYTSDRSFMLSSTDEKGPIPPRFLKLDPENNPDLICTVTMDPKTVFCAHCHERGHWRRLCQKAPPCGKCGRTGHSTSRCKQVAATTVGKQTAQQAREKRKGTGQAPALGVQVSETTGPPPAAPVAAQAATNMPAPPQAHETNTEASAQYNEANAAAQPTPAPRAVLAASNVAAKRGSADQRARAPQGIDDEPREDGTPREPSYTPPSGMETLEAPRELTYTPPSGINSVPQPPEASAEIPVPPTAPAIQVTDTQDDEQPPTESEDEGEVRESFVRTGSPAAQHPTIMVQTPQNGNTRSRWSDESDLYAQ